MPEVQTDAIKILNVMVQEPVHLLDGVKEQVDVLMNGITKKKSKKFNNNPWLSTMASTVA